MRSDGTRFVVPWREPRGAVDVVRVAHVGVDGITDPAIDAVTIARDAAFDVAAEPSATLIAFVDPVGTGVTAVRAVLLPSGPPAPHPGA